MFICKIQKGEAMDTKDFNELLDGIVEEKIRGVLKKKADEYTRGDRLSNFKEAARISKVTALRALRGMQIKHDVSIIDLTDDFDKGNLNTWEMWLEKVTDRINYDILALALIKEQIDIAKSMSEKVIVQP